MEITVTGQVFSPRVYVKVKKELPHRSEAGARQPHPRQRWCKLLTSGKDTGRRAES